MSRVSASYRKLLLRAIKWDADEGGLALGEALKIACRSQIGETKSGKSLIGTSRSGHSVSFALPASGGGYTPTDLTETCSELYDCFEAAVVALGWSLTGDEVLNPDHNQAIYDQMVATCAGFTPVRSYSTDHSQMRQEASFAA